ncbi:unnamed protein product [Calypogeia fissa]
MAEAAALEGVRQCKSDIDKYVYLRHLQAESSSLFYKLLIENAQELLPVVYTPTVGQACLEYSQLPIQMHGLVIQPSDKGNVLAKLKSWGGGNQSVRVVVVTDGERILGLGDLGFNGMGISEGKILLYTVMAGVNPAQCMPIVLDVGTNNPTLLADPTYKGLREKRLRGQEYDDLVDELLTALKEWNEHTLVQFEDFGNHNAFRLLEKYGPRQCCFNDDIQGTACITLAGLLSALRITGTPLKDQTILFLGAGEAGTGIGQLISKAIQATSSLTEEEALKRCFYMDSKGLVVKSRTGLQHHKLPFAHDVPFVSGLLDAVKELKPTMLVGVSTIAEAFTKEVVELLAEINERPIIFPLSNPTSKAECTYEDAFEWTKGKVVFASGSPFPSLKGPDGKTYYPAQANNAYVFGPIGQAALLTNCHQITDDVFLETANILAGLVPESTLELGMLFPTISEMKTLVVPLISGVAEHIVSSRLGTKPPAATKWDEYVRGQMYKPKVYGRALSLKVAPTPVPVVLHEEMQELVMIRHMYTDMQRYLFLRFLQDTQSDTFWNLIINNAQELLPYVYTPTVGEACEKFSNLPIKTRGLFIRQEDSGKILQKLKAWRHQDIEVIVVTDGERILGLGDLGAGGMGISEGKIILYSVIGGVDPKKCLPICLDVGTNRESLLSDPEYIGVRQKRLRGEQYDALVTEFITALKQWQPNVLLQFEDFGNSNAFKLLEQYQTKILSFNDDIQGTACITLAGVLSALRVTGGPLNKQRIMFLGAGEAGTGIGKLIALALVEKYGLPLEAALQHCFFVDSKGLVCKSRTDLQHHKLDFAHDMPYQPNLLAAVKALKPTILIGVSTVAGAFNKEVLECMHENNDRPIIFPLSNPTSKAECTFEEAYQYTGGTVVFASGSPFPPFWTNDDRTLFPAQANNAYIFGPIGKAAVLTKCKTISEELFLHTAELLAEFTPMSRLHSGMLFPAFSDMKEVAPKLIAGIAEYIVKVGLGEQPKEVARRGWLKYVQSQMYEPPMVPTKYKSFL